MLQEAELSAASPRSTLSKAKSTARGVIDITRSSNLNFGAPSCLKKRVPGNFQPDGGLVHIYRSLSRATHSLELSTYAPTALRAPGLEVVIRESTPCFVPLTNNSRVSTILARSGVDCLL